ncbi:MAG: hypothetical protein KDK71_00305 [Chlamydiia bacterium]|nr:hypothetical protein [Chlamydiia bacterium]
MESIKRFLPEAHIIEYQEQGLVEYLGYKCFEPAAFLDLNSWRFIVLNLNDQNPATLYNNKIPDVLCYRPSKVQLSTYKNLAIQAMDNPLDQAKECLFTCFKLSLYVISFLLYLPGLVVGKIIVLACHIFKNEKRERCYRFIETRNALTQMHNELLEAYKAEKIKDQLLTDYQIQLTTLIKLGLGAKENFSHVRQFLSDNSYDTLLHSHLLAVCCSKLNTNHPVREGYENFVSKILNQSTSNDVRYTRIVPISEAKPETLEKLTFYT